MRSLLILLLLYVNAAHAQSINQIINDSLKKHPSLNAIQHRLSAMDARISKSSNWSNPEVILNINDIQFSDITNRSIEPMQYQAIQFKQRFPWFGKITARRDLVDAQKNIIVDSYSAAKVKLAENIRLTAYTILEIKERIRIVTQYEKLSRQNIVLYESYASTDSKSHASSMSAELMLSRLHIRAERYKAVLKSQEAKLAYLSQKKYNHISDTLRVKKPNSLPYYLSRLKHNPSYKRMLSLTKAANVNTRIQALESNPDPFVQVGYFNRHAYEDYASVSVGFSLPMYGSEKLETEVAKKDALATKSATLDYRAALESDIYVNYAKMKEAYHIYNIIRNDSLPKLEHMFELNEASIESGEDLFTYTNLLEQKLDLDEERTVAKAAYLRSVAALDALIGKSK